MRALWWIAYKEWQDAVRNRWMIGATLLLASLAFVLSFLGSTPTGGNLGVKPLAVTVVSLASLSIFLIPLMALLLAYDAIIGEFERGVMLLLLSYPISRNQILFGKFIGHTSVLALATCLGYGAAGAATGFVNGADAESWQAFASLVATSVLLGAVFLALAYLASALARERGAAAGLAVAIWLFFVILYDMGLLGVLVASHGQIRADIFPYFLLANPADVYRLFNLGGFENVRQFSGLAGLSGDLPFSSMTLLAVLFAWVAIPLSLASILFRRMER